VGVDGSDPVIPEWARYLAVDADGAVYAYASMPSEFDGREWFVDTDEPTRCLWHPESGVCMPPALACRLVVPLAARPQSVEV
jgi:hypothetical protein